MPEEAGLKGKPAIKTEKTGETQMFMSDVENTKDRDALTPCSAQDSFLIEGI